LQTAFTSMVECYGWSDERYLLRAVEGAASDLDNVKVQRAARPRTLPPCKLLNASPQGRDSAE
jgi:hypothetical protein